MGIETRIHGVIRLSDCCPKRRESPMGIETVVSLCLKNLSYFVRRGEKARWGLKLKRFYRTPIKSASSEEERKPDGD